MFSGVNNAGHTLAGRPAATFVIDTLRRDHYTQRRARARNSEARHISLARTYFSVAPSDRAAYNPEGFVVHMFPRKLSSKRSISACNPARIHDGGKINVARLVTSAG